ncbi:pentapeptide repeat-containing protein [Campylobacter sp. CCS1377]|uniref:Pentapeptide repeat-containing protein n=1 Tax=Campylobacter sp. CCS1377 TaxID=3158229 RepID=A0AAU7E7C3_9BACT
MEELEQFGILAKNGRQDIKDDKITILGAEIKEINFQTLQEAGIKEICILRSEIKYLYFLEKNTIKIDFENCNFKNQIIARESYFKNEVIFRQCVFDAVVDFSKVEFNSKIDFLASVFKSEVRFIETQFQAEQSNNETIENNFGEIIFERRVSFSSATFQARVNFALSQFKDEVNFTKTKFQANQSNDKIIENHFLGVIFTGKAIFDDAIFKARVSFGISQFENEARFIGTQLLAKQDSNETIENEFRETIFKGKVTFDSLVLKTRISFLFSIFKDEALFLNINPNNFIFHNLEFNKTKFACKTLTNVIFCLFQYSVFKDALSFEGMKIERLRFDNVLFNGVVTFSNTKLNTKPQFINCTFSNQFNIEHQYIKYSDKDIENKINSIQNENDKFQALLNLRDLFRKLKSNRIAHHNLIDASELRTQELYARELELKYQENKSLKEKIEQWQLFFYRKLCDHHTDILQSLNSLILVIGIFGVLNLAIIIGFNCYLGYKPILEHLYFSLDFYNFHIKPFIENNHLFIIFVNFLILFVYLILVGFALCEKYIRKFFITISYVITFFIMITSPKILIPAMGIFTDKRVMLDPLSVLGGIYTIVFGFVVFSFIKTIRKNSIVPS